jgi:hypothetical protein
LAIVEVNSIYLQTLVKKTGQGRGYHFVIQSPIFKDKIKKEKLLFFTVTQHDSGTRKTISWSVNV